MMLPATVSRSCCCTSTANDVASHSQSQLLLHLHCQSSWIQSAQISLQPTVHAAKHSILDGMSSNSQRLFVYVVSTVSPKSIEFRRNPAKQRLKMSLLLQKHVNIVATDCRCRKTFNIGRSEFKLSATLRICSINSLPKAHRIPI
jgi:hypothetical protein